MSLGVDEYLFWENTLVTYGVINKSVVLSYVISGLTIYVGWITILGFFGSSSRLAISIASYTE